MVNGITLYGKAQLPKKNKELEEKGHKIIRETIQVEKTNGKKAFVTRYAYADENYQRKEIKEPQFQF